MGRVVCNKEWTNGITDWAHYSPMISPLARHHLLTGPVNFPLPPPFPLPYTVLMAEGFYFWETDFAKIEEEETHQPMVFAFDDPWTFTTSPIMTKNTFLISKLMGSREVMMMMCMLPTSLYPKSTQSGQRQRGDQRCHSKRPLRRPNFQSSTTKPISKHYTTTKSATKSATTKKISLLLSYIRKRFAHQATYQSAQMNQTKMTIWDLITGSVNNRTKVV